MANYNDDIVISGIGGYFPGSKDVAECKKKLFGNEIPMEERWSKDHGVSNLVGGVDNTHFDNSFFGIHKHQTVYMDPLHRLAMERSFETVVDAGVNPTSLRGKKIGCFMGLTMNEKNSFLLDCIISGFGVTGYSRSMLANRISYFLDLKGPSVVYDCNWITGLEVIRLACRAIRNGECEAAIVGAVNLIYFPEIQMIFDELNFVSPDGSTRAFDENAQGYARSDGIVTLFIQKSSDAKRAYGSIVHVNTQCDGAIDNEILKINSCSITEFLESFFRNSPVKPEEIDYVETYGCGIKDIDKAELDALEKVYCKNRSQPLLIGSVKTQFGHSEVTSTLFSLVKVLLAMEEEMLPATLQIQQPNSSIRGLHNGHLEIVRTNTKWTSEYAAVNAIGAINYFGHIIIKRNPKRKVESKAVLPLLFPVSSRTEDTVLKALSTLKQKPDDLEFHRLVQDVFSSHIPAHMYCAFVLKGEDSQYEHFSFQEGTKPSVWFVYSGMGSQWNGMLSDLMRFPIVAESITRSCNILASKGLDLMDILTSMKHTVFDNILHCFVGIAAMQVALTDLLKAVGIVPDGIIGHSVGELGCAYADGCITAEQMILSAYYRGKASLDKPLIKGKMAAVGLGYNQIKDQLAPRIEVACHNGPESCTLSGPAEDMEVFVNKLKQRGIFASLVNVANIAYHSTYIKPVAPLLEEYLKAVIPERKLRSSKWISTSNKFEDWDTDLAKYSSAEYHTNNLLSSVLFEEGCKHIPKNAVLIEIAPHGLLQAILKRSLPTCSSTSITSRRTPKGAEFLLKNLGNLYLQGIDMNISAIYPPVEFPVSRNTPTLTDLAGWNHTEQWEVNEVNEKQDSSKIVRLALNTEKYDSLLEHRIKGNVVVPVSFYLNLLYQNLETHSENIILENLHFNKHLTIPDSARSDVQLILQLTSSGKFEFWSNKDLILSGKVHTTEKDEAFDEFEEVDLKEDFLTLDKNEIYDELKHRGYDHTGSIRILKQLLITDQGSVSEIECCKWPTLIEAMIQQQAFVSGEKFQNVQLPHTIQQITIQSKKISNIRSPNRIYYHYDTKILNTDAVKIEDLTMTSWDVQESNFVLESVDYISLERVSFKEIESALELCVQLTRNNFARQGMETLLVTNWGPNKKSFYTELQNVSKALSHMNVIVTNVSSMKEICIQENYPQLIVFGDDPVEDVLKKISSSEVFLFTKTTSFSLTYPGIIEIVRIEINKDEYSMFRKANTADVITVNICNETSDDESNKGFSKWFLELKEAVKASKCQKKRVFLLSSSLPVEGFEYFIREIRRRPDMENVRFLFNLDKTNDFQSLFQRNLSVSILKNGRLHTNVYQCTKYKNNNFGGSFKRDQRNKIMQYVGLNLEDETLGIPLDHKGSVRTFDYSGTEKNGDEVMGISHIHEDGYNIDIDPIFKWKVPKNWSLQEAATVPHAYLSAYYMMVVKGKLQEGFNVLIHAGCSPIGLAAISIAFLEKCNIFTTVFNKQQKHYLLSTFKFLNENQIYILEDVSFKIHFMRDTNGEGARLIISCLSGDLIKSSLDCCGEWCSIIHYGKYDVENGTNIGMARFMRNVSLYFVDLDRMFGLKDDVKQQLWQLVSNGLAKNEIKALAWNFGTHQDIFGLLSTIKSGSAIGKIILNTSDLFADSLVNVFTNNKFICSPNSSLIVFGGNFDNWMNMVEWLVHRGAKKIIGFPDSEISPTNDNRRLSLIKKYFGTDIILFREKIQTKKNVIHFLNQASALGPTQALFLLPTESSAIKQEKKIIIETLVSGLERLSPGALFVNFIPSAVGIFQMLADVAHRVFNIELTKDGDIRQGLFALNQVVLSGSCHTVIRKQLEKRHNITDIGKVLPKLNEIMKNQTHSTLQPEILQILTDGPVKIRELAPIFIIHGIAGRKELEKMTKDLIYPTYCTSIPSTLWPIEKLAETYAEKIEKIYPKNVYNLISVSTGGALMVEIARILRKRSEDVELNLFFIDSAPTIAQEAIVQLGEDTDFEVNILRVIFDINDAKVLSKLKSFGTWDEKIHFCIKSYNDQNKLSLLKGLRSLKHMLDTLKKYRPQRMSMNGTVHLLRPSVTNEVRDCDLGKIFNQKPLIEFIEGDHQSIIGHPDTIKYINFHVDV